MYLDALQQFDNAALVAIAPGTQASTNVLDYGELSGIPSSANGGGARDMGIGDTPALQLLVQVAQAFVGAGGSLQISFQGAQDNGAGAPGAFSTWFSTQAFPVAQLNAGARLMDMDFPRPPQGQPIPRYVRLLYTVAGATFTAGALTSYVLLRRDDQIYNGLNNAQQGGYPAGITVPN